MTKGNLFYFGKPALQFEELSQEWRQLRCINCQPHCNRIPMSDYVESDTGANRFYFLSTSCPLYSGQLQAGRRALSTAIPGKVV